MFGVVASAGFSGLDFLMCDDDVNCECILKLVEPLILYRVHSCMVFDKTNVAPYKGIIYSSVIRFVSLEGRVPQYALNSCSPRKIMIQNADS